MTLPDVTVIDSLAPVQRAFNACDVRVLAVLSPTHPACVQGLRALKAALNRSTGRVCTMVAWTPVRSSDTRDQLVKATMHLPAARHFVDEERLVGQAVARTVCGADQIAWNTYLFYSPEASWDSLGDPAVWFHGLEGCNWVPPERYCSEDCEAAFAETLASLNESP